MRLEHHNPNAAFRFGRAGNWLVSLKTAAVMLWHLPAYLLFLMIMPVAFMLLSVIWLVGTIVFAIFSVGRLVFAAVFGFASTINQK